MKYKAGDVVVARVINRITTETLRIVFEIKKVEVFHLMEYVVVLEGSCARVKFPPTDEWSCMETSDWDGAIVSLDKIETIPPGVMDEYLKAHLI